MLKTKSKRRSKSILNLFKKQSFGKLSLSLAVSTAFFACGGPIGTPTPGGSPNFIAQHNLGGTVTPSVGHGSPTNPVSQYPLDGTWTISSGQVTSAVPLGLSVGGSIGQSRCTNTAGLVTSPNQYYLKGQMTFRGNMGQWDVQYQGNLFKSMTFSVTYLSQTTITLSNFSAQKCSSDGQNFNDCSNQSTTNGSIPVAPILGSGVGTSNITYTYAITGANGVAQPMVGTPVANGIGQSFLSLTSMSGSSMMGVASPSGLDWLTCPVVGQTGSIGGSSALILY